MALGKVCYFHRVWCYAKSGVDIGRDATGADFVPTQNNVQQAKMLHDLYDDGLGMDAEEFMLLVVIARYRFLAGSHRPVQIDVLVATARYIRKGWLQSPSTGICTSRKRQVQSPSILCTCYAIAGTKMACSSTSRYKYSL